MAHARERGALALNPSPNDIRSHKAACVDLKASAFLRQRPQMTARGESPGRGSGTHPKAEHAEGCSAAPHTYLSRFRRTCPTPGASASGNVVSKHGSDRSPHRALRTPCVSACLPSRSEAWAFSRSPVSPEGNDPPNDPEKTWKKIQLSERHGIGFSGYDAVYQR